MNFEWTSELNNKIGERIVRRSFWLKIAAAVLAVTIGSGIAFNFWPDQIKADSVGPRFATASGDCVNDTSAAGTISWTSPGNAFSDNATNATVALDGTTSEYIKCTNFGFTSGMIPSGATINGIVVTIERSVNSSANLRDAAVRIVKGGSIGSTDKSTATAYTTSMVAEDHGGTSDLWGETWSPSDITASNFGVAYSALNSSSAGGAETVSVDYISITVHYEFNISFDQSAYRWYGNTDSTDVGSPLAAQNTAIVLSSAGQDMRLRTTLHISENNLVQSGINFKLQYAGKGGGTCAAPSGTPSSYTDVTAGTSIAYLNNATPADGAGLTTNANDPTHASDSNIAQSYEELNNFTNSEAAINSGQDGLWDFALTDNGAPAGSTYCFRIAKSDGSALESYTVYPEVTTELPPLEQAGYRWFGDVEDSGTPNGGPTNINDASDFTDPYLVYESSRNIVRTSSGTLYAFLVDGTECEIWKSANGTSWTEQDASNNPVCGVGIDGNFGSMAVDSNDLIHLLYVLVDSTDILYYSTFNTTTDTFGSPEQLATGNEGFDAGEIVVDSNNKPHVVGYTDSFPLAVDYYNKVSGSWSKINDISTEMFVKWDVHIVINEDNIPEIIVYDAGFNIDVLLGNANNATSFSTYSLESTIGNSGNFGSMAVDSAGNTWVAYQDENGSSDYISLAQHNDADGWTTWQTPVTNNNVGIDPSIAINGTDVYVFYEDENNDIVYDMYNGSAWKGETVLQTGTFQYVKSKNANFFNYDSTGYTNYSTYYFDGSDAPASDPDNVWTNETNADDGNTGTTATTSAQSLGEGSNNIKIEGTNAPASGETIVGVRARIHNGSSWSNYGTISSPVGGWSWAALQGLEVLVYSNTSFDNTSGFLIYEDGDYSGTILGSASVGPGGTVSKVEILVQTSYNPQEIDYLYSDGTDVYWASLGMGPSPTDVGAALAAQDASYTMTAAGEDVRLRALVGVSTNALPSGGGNFKLQYVDKGSGTCSAPSGGTPSSYTDVTTSTAIAYRDQANAADNTSLTANVSDPARGGVDVVAQSYNELNPFTNLNVIPAGDDGLWDMALIDNGAPAGTTYCLRIIRDDGVLLDTYSQYPQLTTFGSGGGQTEPTMNQRIGRGNWWLDGVRQFLHLD